LVFKTVSVFHGQTCPVQHDQSSFLFYVDEAGHHESANRDAIIIQAETQRLGTPFGKVIHDHPSISCRLSGAGWQISNNAP